MGEVDEGEVRAALERLGLAGPDERLTFVRLTGGVSSDIWRVELPAGRSASSGRWPSSGSRQDWRAPVERNAYEAAWMRTAAAIVPEAVPELLGQDAARACS